MIHFDLVVSTDKKKPHIKKPLNAFMLYMKEMRAKVVAECTLKESAAINQILGRRVSKSSIRILLRRKINCSISESLSEFRLDQLIQFNSFPYLLNIVHLY